MIIGFNSELEQEGLVYHVQTSDKPNRQIIETLIYLGGEIVDTLVSPYSEALRGAYDERKVIKLMQTQHRRSIFAIKKGKFSKTVGGAEAAAEIEAVPLTDAKGLDDMIFEYLATKPEQEKLELVMATNSRFFPGAAVFMRLVAATSLTRQPIRDARVQIVIEGAGAYSGAIYEGKTDEEGEANIMVIIPREVPVPSTLLMRGESPLGEDEIAQEIRQR